MKNKTVMWINSTSIALVYSALLIYTLSCKNAQIETIIPEKPNNSSLEELQRMKDEYLGLLASQPTSFSNARAIAISYVDLTPYFPNVGGSIILSNH